MIKTILAQVKQYKKASILTPVFMVLEVVVDILIPRAMALLIDRGIQVKNVQNIYFLIHTIVKREKNDKK